MHLVSVVHDSLVGVTILITRLSVEPVDEVRDDRRDVDWLQLEIRIVLDGSAVSEERLINEVPARLPVATL